MKTDRLEELKRERGKVRAKLRRVEAQIDATERELERMAKPNRSARSGRWFDRRVTTK